MRNRDLRLLRKAAHATDWMAAFDDTHPDGDPDDDTPEPDERTPIGPLDVTPPSPQPGTPA